MMQPLCWIDKNFDRSPAELLWAETDRWGPLNGRLLNLSYGYGKIFVVLPQKVGAARQGGMVELPVPQFPTGIMRGRFNAADGQLYLCGMSAWATNQMQQTGGLYRVRYTGDKLHLPVEMEALAVGMQLIFATTLDRKTAEDKANYTITVWDLERSRKYGSDRLNTRTLEIDQVTLGRDKKTVLIALPDIAPTWAMEISYSLYTSSGKAFSGAIQNTIHVLQPEKYDEL